jgi:hypothetical protein
LDRTCAAWLQTTTRVFSNLYERSVIMVMKWPSGDDFWPDLSPSNPVVPVTSRLAMPDVFTASGCRVGSRIHGYTRIAWHPGAAYQVW